MTGPPPLEDLKRIGHRGKGLSGRSRWYRLNRELSIRISWLLLHTPVRANQVSWAMVGLALFAALLATLDTPAASLAASALLYLSWLLDRVDGELARARREESWRGAYLDWVYHRVAPSAVHVGFAAAVYARDPSGWTLALLALIGPAVLLVKENSEAVHNLYPRVGLAAPTADRDPAAAGAERRRSGSRLFELASLHLSAAGAAGLYALATGAETLTGTDLLSPLVVVQFVATAGLACVGVQRLARGGIEDEIQRVRRANDD